MDKIKLSDSKLTEFDLIPNGIEEKTDQKLRYFKFITPLIYEDVFTLFNSSENLTKVFHILADGQTDTTYTDCVALKSLKITPNYKIDDKTTATVYTAELSIDAVEKALKSFNENLTGIQQRNDNAVAELTIMIASVYGLLA